MSKKIVSINFHKPDAYKLSVYESSGGYGYLIQRLVKEVTEALNESEKLSKNVAIEQAIFFEKSVIRYFQK